MNPIPREIKFRIWYEGEMYYPYDRKGNIIIRNGGDIILEESLGMPFSRAYKSLHGAVIMQYTGVKDKNDKEIYEGDIVNGCEFNGSYAYGKIEYFTDAFVISPIGKFIEGCGGLFYNNHRIEVIGNIYENDFSELKNENVKIC